MSRAAVVALVLLLAVGSASAVEVHGIGDGGLPGLEDLWPGGGSEGPGEEGWTGPRAERPFEGFRDVATGYRLRTAPAPTERWRAPSTGGRQDDAVGGSSSPSRAGEFTGAEGGAVPFDANDVEADTDGDGLTDLRERLQGTDPARADTDGDGLPDAQEIALGSDPTLADTDGDRLLDGWEAANRTPGGAALPDADPLRMDLYVQVNYGPGSARLSATERRIVERAFDRMPVRNPDGSTGIAVHLDDAGRVVVTPGRTVTVDHPADQGRLESAYYTPEYLGNRTGVYHQVLVVDVDDRLGVAGLGDAPGRFVVVDADRTGNRTGTIPLRTRAAIHELLHNVVGRVPDDDRGDYLPEIGPDDPYHTDAGWLHDDPRTLRRHEFLPEHVAEELESEGFEG